jgi:hypothetical protein
MCEILDLGTFKPLLGVVGLIPDFCAAFASLMRLSCPATRRKGYATSRRRMRRRMPATTDGWRRIF